MKESPLVPFFFLAAVFCATFEKVHWNFLGQVSIADVTSLCFLGVYALDRLGRPASSRIPRAAALLIMILLPLLILTPIYLRLERGHRWRLRLAVLIALLLISLLATLSRSGALGLVVGAIVLAFPYRHLLFSRLAVLPLTLVVLPVGYAVWLRRHFFDVVVHSRLSGGSGASSHLDVYKFIPKILHSHPFFGLGFNNFSVYYQFVTGKTNWGPHSYYVMLIVEGGLVGTALFAVFLWFLFHRLGAARKVGRALAAARDPLAARVRPLAWGMTAALLGTMAANIFYLTMSFFYFYVFAMLVLVTPALFARGDGDFRRVDRSFQTDARAKPARPEVGTASGASG